jgi:hypothetical protein
VPAPFEIDATAVAAIIFNNLFMVAADLEKIGVLRFLAARFHAHLILSLAGRASIVFHAGSLLIGANLAA